MDEFKELYRKYPWAVYGAVGIALLVLLYLFFKKRSGSAVGFTSMATAPQSAYNAPLPVTGDVSGSPLPGYGGSSSVVTSNVYSPTDSSVYSPTDASVHSDVNTVSNVVSSVYSPYESSIFSPTNIDNHAQTTDTNTSNVISFMQSLVDSHNVTNTDSHNVGGDYIGGLGSVGGFSGFAGKAPVNDPGLAIPGAKVLRAPTKVTPIVRPTPLQQDVNQWWNRNPSFNGATPIRVAPGKLPVMS